MLVTKKLATIQLKDIDKINWRPSSRGLWTKQDDIDLIKIYRTFENNYLKYYLKERFPDKTLVQCKIRYNNTYAPHIKKYSLSEDDKKYIIQKKEQYDLDHMAYDLGVSYFLVRNYANKKDTNQKKLSKVSIRENLPEIPVALDSYYDKSTE